MIDISALYNLIIHTIQYLDETFVRTQDKSIILKKIENFMTVIMFDFYKRCCKLFCYSIRGDLKHILNIILMYKDYRNIN